MPKGFTLVEILVAITILSVAAVVAIPNLKKFNEDQELNNTSSDIIRVLRQAQSGMASSIICKEQTSSDSWKVSIVSSDASQLSYTLYCNYKDASGGDASIIVYTKQVPGITLDFTKSSCDTPGSIEIKYSKNKAVFLCSSTESPREIFDISLKKSSKHKTVSIDKGGSISLKDE